MGQVHIVDWECTSKILQNQFVTNFEEAIAKNDFRHFPLFEIFALIYFCREIEFLLIYSFLKNRLQKLRMRKF